MPELHFIEELARKHTLADFGSEVLLLDVWATWCAPCRRAMPSLERLQSKVGNEKFRSVAISADEEGVSAVRFFYRQRKIRSLEIFADYNGEAERELNVPGLPTSLLVKKTGWAIGVKVGPWEWGSKEMIALISNEVDAG